MQSKYIFFEFCTFFFKKIRTTDSIGVAIVANIRYMASTDWIDDYCHFRERNRVHQKRLTKNRQPLLEKKLSMYAKLYSFTYNTTKKFCLFNNFME